MASAREIHPDAESKHSKSEPPASKGNEQMFKGSFTALITPFRNSELDEEAFCRIVEWQIAEGTHGLVPVGTTGESPTLSHAEHKRVVELTVEVAKGRVPVIAGAGSNATSEAIVDIPIIIYNIPGRSVVDMTVDTMKRCFALKNVVGVKDATANLARASQQRAAMGSEFNMLSGEDATALGFNAHGGHGCISVTSNIAPRLCAQFQEACLAGDFRTALALQDRLMPLHDALFCEANPGPVKYAASRLGLCGAETRLPLAPLAEASKKIVDAALARVGLIQARAAE
jgi:4-hydroxy-tetrahydrodipicolinate synthase